MRSKEENDRVLQHLAEQLGEAVAIRSDEYGVGTEDGPEPEEWATVLEEAITSGLEAAYQREADRLDADADA